MLWRLGTLVACIALISLCPGHVQASTDPVLFAFGPGGPHRALSECAQQFEQASGIRVEVLRSGPDRLAQNLRAHGDLYYGGAEYMLEEFARRHPDILDLDSAALTHPRRIGILVRRGNPLGIEGPHHLAGEKVELLTARREQMEPFHPPGEAGSTPAKRTVESGWEGVRAWRAEPSLDAWVTYHSWHRVLQGESEFVPIDHADAVRYTPLAATRHTPHRGAALQFIEFLQTPAARRIFEEHGWY